MEENSKKVCCMSTILCACRGRDDNPAGGKVSDHKCLRAPSASSMQTSAALPPPPTEVSRIKGSGTKRRPKLRASTSMARLCGRAGFTALARDRGGKCFPLSTRPQSRAPAFALTSTVCLYKVLFFRCSIYCRILPVGLRFYASLYFSWLCN